MFSYMYIKTCTQAFLRISPLCPFVRVWEKLMAAIQAKAPTGGFKKVVASWAKGKGLKGTNNMQKG